MKRIYLLLALLLAVLLLTVTACTEDPAPAESDTPAVTQPETDAPTEPETDPVTEPETDAPTDPVTEPEETEPETDPPKKYREDWDPEDPENPYYNLIEVGTSYDGVTTCYDGRYDFGYEVARASDGTTFTSVQEAIYYFEGIGGTISIIAPTNICLKLDIPDDEMFYRIYYEFKNVDFVFNRGTIYDDCAPNDEGVRGFAYYSDLYVLDSIMNLQDTYVWIIAPFEQLEAGRYVMIDEYVEDDDWYFIYNYEKTSDIDAWYGLPHGEELPE